MMVETRVAEPAARASRWAVLANADFRLLWLFHVSNFLAIVVEMLSTGWLVLELTDSPFWLGAVAGIRGVSQIAFGLLSGHLADRYDRRLLVGVAQIVRTVAVGTVAGLAISGNLTLWQLLAGSFVQGLVVATVSPAGEALIYDTVGPDRLLSAVALKMGAISVARIPAGILTGWAIAAIGASLTLLAAAAIFFLSPLALILIRPRFQREPNEESALAAIRAGFAYALRTRPVATLLVISAIGEFFGFSYNTLLPVLARDVLQVGAAGLGLLTTVTAISGVIATAVLTGRRGSGEKGSMLMASIVACGLTLVAIGLVPYFPATIAFSLVLGAAFLVFDANMSTLVQVQSADAMRGRVLGLYGLTWGFTSLGGLFAGTIAGWAGVPAALAVCGIALVASAAVLLPGRNGYDRPANDPPI